MLSKKDKQKFLNKFKFIEKINGFSRNWWQQGDLVCKKCELYYKPRKAGDISACAQLNPGLIYEKNTIVETKAPGNNLGRDCVEFLRRPMNFAKENWKKNAK